MERRRNNVFRVGVAPDVPLERSHLTTVVERRQLSDGDGGAAGTLNYSSAACSRSERITGTSGGQGSTCGSTRATRTARIPSCLDPSTSWTNAVANHEDSGGVARA